jgi:CRISPR/Cas system-associated endoribonuclease Cas2
MKGDLTHKMLELISRASLKTTDTIAAFLTSPYGSSYKTIEYNLERREHRRGRAILQKEERQRYYNLLYTLKKEGLIKEVDQGLLSVTEKGRAWLLRHKNNNRQVPAVRYTGLPHDRFIIVAFDIPEKERFKRDWLRTALKSLGLQMIQRSVWMGKVKLPALFLSDVRKLRLLDSVEIFEITRTGTLKHLL